VLELPGRRLRRLEYLLEPEGGDAAPDPENPERAPGAFGEKSVWCAEDYVAPWWIEEGREAVPATIHELPVRSRALRTTARIGVWEPDDAAGRELPLLVVHDGPETDALARITRYVGVMVAECELPACRVALLPPGRRDEWYSAGGTYARALCAELLPAVREAFPTTKVVAMGASLGGLAALHAQRSHPHCVDGLFLQSSSFFTPEHDGHESGFPRWRRITRFVRATTRSPVFAHPCPVVLTCGAEEENIHNNREMAAALERQGYEVTFVEVGDLHNYTAWRDALDPHLTRLLVQVWEGIRE
jgi:enterochelin esterase-like enzyme